MYISENGIMKETSFEQGETLLSVLRRNGCSIKAPCGGNGKCGKCTVRLLRANGALSDVLACQTAAVEGSTVFLEYSGADLSWSISDFSPVSIASASGLGAAVDLGTTSIAVSLFDLAAGKRLACRGEWNAQQSWGADVITRISYTEEHPDGLSALSECVRQQIARMIADLCISCGRQAAEIRSAFLAGNTTMQHIFAALPPESIAHAPFEPLSYFAGEEVVDLSGLPVKLSPCVSGYVGGDITAGILALKMDEKEEIDLLIDVGTNGEMVLGGKSGFVTCAVACGPAFEGAGISCGMPAENGAVNRVFLTDEGLGFEVIGGEEARGICGSGLLDLTACLLELGYISSAGQLLYGGDNGEEACFYLTDTVFLTARDVRQLQLAKAAVAAGIQVLLKYSGISFREISTLYLAGGFGSRLDPRSAAGIGMLPAELLDRVRTAGNSSLAGAEEALLSLDARCRLLTIRKMCFYLELSGMKEFNDCFIEELGFPDAVDPL